MCWRRQNVEDDDDRDALIQERLLRSDYKENNVVVNTMSNNDKQKQYNDIKNKYKKRSSLDVPRETFQASGGKSSNNQHNISDTASETESVAQKSTKKKSSIKSKLSIKSSSNKQEIQNAGIANPVFAAVERGDNLEELDQKAEELHNNARHVRSLSKKLKEKQAAKLKKSALPW